MFCLEYGEAEETFGSSSSSIMDSMMFKFAVELRSLLFISLVNCSKLLVLALREFEFKENYSNFISYLEAKKDSSTIAMNTFKTT